MTVSVKAKRQRVTKCPYCHDEVKASQHRRVQCQDCGAIEHLDCWDPDTSKLEDGQCSSCNSENGKEMRKRNKAKTDTQEAPVDLHSLVEKVKVARDKLKDFNKKIEELENQLDLLKDEKFNADTDYEYARNELDRALESDTDTDDE